MGDLEFGCATLVMIDQGDNSLIYHSIFQGNDFFVPSNRDSDLRKELMKAIHTPLLKIGFRCKGLTRIFWDLDGNGLNSLDKATFPDLELTYVSPEELLTKD